MLSIVRPVRTSDLPAIERLSIACGIGVASRPGHRDWLFERIRRSIESFDHEAVADAGHEYYMFVLEEDGLVIATVALAASAGFDEPFYSYRSETLVHASRALNVHNRIHALNMCHDLTGLVQLGDVIADASLEPASYELLMRAGLLFIACHRGRFGRRIIAEMPGLHDASGQSPFWDAIGRRFFNMDFPQVEQAFLTHSKTFIAELMPSYPIYVPLLPDAAQAALGHIHPACERPLAILLGEGFEEDNYIDIFDGGAVLTADIDRLYTLEAARLYPVEVEETVDGGEPMLLANLATDEFCATWGLARCGDGHLRIGAELAQTLAVGGGGQVRAVGAQNALREDAAC
ncbi:arginine N-succinyltransferase [Paludibacterium yongneupense]|uniref:arginine N-succinyltransferase n=1 Tax=Paludibacterium yongneupense TaxID=400061 RepID=UPI0004195DC0|nr:arginine N-succinyltransferase [Paludibacterium yongneupense]